MSKDYSANYKALFRWWLAWLRDHTPIVSGRAAAQAKRDEADFLLRTYNGMGDPIIKRGRPRKPKP